MTKAIRIGNVVLGDGIPKICAPLTGRDRSALAAEAERICRSGADLAEWRADLWDGSQAETGAFLEEMKDLIREIRVILQGIPLLFTIRTKSEGGRAVLPEEAFEEAVRIAARSGADLVDVEAFQGDPARRKDLIRDLQNAGAVVIASSHDFEKTDPKEALLRRFKAMDETGADILKLAVMPVREADVTALMEATREMAERYTQKPLIAMSMGEMGVRSRIQGASFGSSVTFGTVDKASAPGQLPVERLRQLLGR